MCRLQLYGAGGVARRGDRRSVGGLASVSMGHTHVVYFAVLMFSQIGPNTHAAWANGKWLKFGKVAEDTTLGTFAISKGALQPAFTSKLVNYSCSESYETHNITIYAKACVRPRIQLDARRSPGGGDQHERSHRRHLQRAKECHGVHG